MVNGSLELPIVDLTPKCGVRAFCTITPCLPLADQQQLTAVETVCHRPRARDHSAAGQVLRIVAPRAAAWTGSAVCLRGRSGSLLPAGKACVTACHTLNGLDEKRDLARCGLARRRYSQQPVDAACDDRLFINCLDPGCMKGCPVDAYEKDPVTGIVKHLKYHSVSAASTARWPARTMCRNITRRKGSSVSATCARTGLAVGEAPACVQACPHQRSRFASSMWPRSWRTPRLASSFREPQTRS